jgi:ABC-type sugar transport system substrate-binding protein
MEEDVVRLHGAGKTVYAVSPELHGFSFTQAQARWDDFARWGVDGICTNVPDPARVAATQRATLGAAA